MSTIASGYDYVFELASQLSPEEQERLVREMDAHRQEPEPPKEINWAEFGLMEYTVPGKPIVSAEKMEALKRQSARRQARKSPEDREKLLEVLLNCPVMTDEELKGFEEARKEINECRLAYL